MPLSLSITLSLSLTHTHTRPLSLARKYKSNSNIHSRIHTPHTRTFTHYLSLYLAVNLLSLTLSDPALMFLQTIARSLSHFLQPVLFNSALLSQMLSHTHNGKKSNALNSFILRIDSFIVKVLVEQQVNL
jgi:hypothetical protein